MADFSGILWCQGGNIVVLLCLLYHDAMHCSTWENHNSGTAGQNGGNLTLMTKTAVDGPWREAEGPSGSPSVGHCSQRRGSPI